MNRKPTGWFTLLVTLGALTAGIAAYAKQPPPPPPPTFNCRWVVCAYPDCLPIEHTEIPPGQCCPVCVPN